MTTLSQTLFFAPSPSLRQHLTTHCPHRKTATTNFEYFWHQPPLCGSRRNKFPAPQTPSTVTCLPGNPDVRSSSVTAQSVPVCPRSVAPRHHSNSVSCVDRHAEGLPLLSKDLPGLSALQSFPPHSYTSGRLHAAGSPFSSRPRRPRGASSDVTACLIADAHFTRWLEVIPITDSIRGTRPIGRLDIPLLLSADHHRPEKSV
jgi:hypothetical protein